MIPMNDPRPMVQQIGAVTLSVVLAVNCWMLIANMAGIRDTAERVKSLEVRADRLREEILENRKLHREVLRHFEKGNE